MAFLPHHRRVISIRAANNTATSNPPSAPARIIMPAVARFFLCCGGTPAVPKAEKISSDADEFQPPRRFHT
jgi:hypothetical protein